MTEETKPKAKKPAAKKQAEKPATKGKGPRAVKLKPAGSADVDIKQG